MKKFDGLAWLLFLALALTWGSSFILMKYGLQSFSYSQIGMIRIACAFWFTLIFAFRRYARIRRKDLLPLLVVGLMGNAIPYLLFPLAVSHLDSGVVGVLNATVPLFTLLIGIAVFKTKVGWQSMLGIGLGLTGALLLLLPGIQVDMSNLSYSLYPIIATLCYATSINTTSARLLHLDSLTITLVSLTFVGLPATVYVFSTDFLDILANDPKGMTHFGYVLILAICGTSLAAIVFNYLIKRSGSLFSASVTYVIPIVALFWGLLDGEEMGWYHVFGMVAILVGVYIVNYRKKFRDQKKAANS